MNLHRHDSNVISVVLNDTTHNCSLYSLTNGRLRYYNSLNPDGEEVQESSFPAYFVTNCSEEVLRHYVYDTSSNLASSDIWDPRNASLNDGDSFVSLMFTISGTCCVCWMLCVFLALSPSHKRKPVLTQLATVFFTVVLTILLAKVTKTARRNYYSDIMDIAEVHDVFFDNLTYRVTNVFSEFLISLAFLEIVAKVSHKRYRLGILAGMIVLVVVYVVVGGICEGQYRWSTTRQIFSPGPTPYTRWHQAKNGLKLVYVGIVGLLLLYYTTLIKNPRKYSHSKKLIPLAIFIWLLFASHVTVSILLVTSFLKDWATRSWLSILLNLLEIGILSLVWEWIYDIRSLERRNELMGVLGRRISVDDLRIFQDNEDERSRARKTHRNKVVGWVKRLFSRNEFVENDLRESTTSSSKEEDSSTRGTGDQQYQEESAPVEPPEPVEQGQGAETVHEVNTDGFSDENEDTNVHDDRLGHEFDDEVIEDYNFYSDNEGEADPPPFVPHPGFQADDYWPEKRA